jgi:3-hydroxyisobutyrate dehydrogenase-like beta-hydroxyacid dehydrogenase
MTNTATEQTVSVIGLGLMGSALARAFLNNHHQVTVWNRTASKCGPLAQAGARVAESVAAAVEASAVIAVCVIDYDASDALLHTPEVAARLQSKVLVQFTTGTPGQARAAEGWAQQHGIQYLDAAIMSYPKGIGAPDCTILYAGPEKVFAAHQPLLSSLGGNALFVGEGISTACTLDSSILSFYYGSALGFLHGAALCEVEGVSLSDYQAIAVELLPVVGDTMKLSAEMIEKGNYEGAEGAIVTHAAALAHINQLTREAGVDSSFAECLSGYFAKAAHAGYGQCELPAVFESFFHRVARVD